VRIGCAAEVLEILDFYAAARYIQNDVISLTRQSRSKGMRDEQIIDAMGLQERRPFMSDPQYLAHLTGFISSRLPRDERVSQALNSMYLSQRMR
jgi:hypothetical protein